MEQDDVNGATRESSMENYRHAGMESSATFRYFMICDAKYYCFVRLGAFHVPFCTSSCGR